MRTLGDVVFLAGPNGAGKSRLLRLLEPRLAAALQATSSLLSLRQQLERGERDQGSYNRKSQAYIEQLASTGVTLRGETQDRRVIQFVPRSLTILDPGNLPPNKLYSAHVSFAGSNPDNWAAGGLHYLQAVQNLWFEATHPFGVKGNDQQDAIDQYDALRTLISDLTGLGLGRSREGMIQLGGFAPERLIAQLSDGQRVLLLLASKLHALGARLRGSILLLDEPENHLHPSALVEVFGRLRAAVGDGQLWIASHSVHLLAEVNLDSVWYMEDGRIQWAGRRASTVLDGLLGVGNGHISRLHDLLALPWRIAAVKYAAECLVPPAPVDTGGADKQLAQIRALVKRADANVPLRVLDFGFGKARLLGALEEWASESGREMVKTFDYVGFDPVLDRDGCGRIAATFGSAHARAYDSLADIEAEQGPFDVVVLCNVLHEIAKDNWLEIWRQIARLSPNGSVIVVEDLHLPTGENAHKHGFLLLRPPALRALVGSTAGDPQFITSDATGGHGRLMACAFPARYGLQVDSVTVDRALQNVREHSREEIARIRGLPQSEENARLHAMYVFLYANACLACK